MIVDIDNVTPNGKVLYYIVCTDDALSFDMDQMYACVRARLCMYVCVRVCVCKHAYILRRKIIPNMNLPHSSI